MNNLTKLLCIGALSTNLFALDCKNAFTTYDMSQCAQIDYKKADKELNKVYKKLMALLDDEGKELLKNSQRSWVNFRDNEAEFSSDSFRGGSAQGILYTSTLIDLTKNRTDSLNKYMETYK